MAQTSEESYEAKERTECRAFSTIPVSQLQQLQDLLTGLAGTSGRAFRHHEVVKKAEDQPMVLVYLQQSLDASESQARSSAPAKQSPR